MIIRRRSVEQWNRWNSNFLYLSQRHAPIGIIWKDLFHLFLCSEPPDLVQSIAPKVKRLGGGQYRVRH